MPQAQYQFLLDLANTKFQPDLISCGLAAQDQPSTYDITNKVMEASIRRGRDNELDPFGPGSMTLLLDNTDWRFTPDYGASPLYNYLRPGAMVTARVPVPDYTGLVSWWTLDEAGASPRYDSYGTNHLSVGSIGTVTSVAGHINNSARVGGTDWLQVASNSTIQAGDTDFSVACWVKLESSFISGYIASKFNDAAGGNEWVLWYGSGVFKFTVYTTGGAATTVTASTFGTPTAGTWYFIMAFHDSVNNVIGISVNNGTIDTSSYSSGVAAGSAALVIGAYDGGAFSSDRFSVDNFSFWRRVLPTVTVTNTVTTLILDQFTDTNGTAIASHAIAPTNTPATSWTAVAGTWTISSNKLVCADNNAAAQVTCDAGDADVTVSLQFTTPSSFGAGTPLNPGIAARLTDGTHYWGLDLDAGASTTMRIVEWNGGATVRASTTVSLATSTTYTLTAILSGASIRLQLDGANEISYSSATLNQTTTRHGVHVYNGGTYQSTVTYDNFQVTDQ